MRYEIKTEDMARVEKDFKFHPSRCVEQQARHECVRATMLAAARQVLELCPPSRERSLAITKLEEAMLWANAAIARNESGGPQ